MALYNRESYLISLLNNTGFECLFDLLNETLNPEHEFVKDLLDVKKNHKEFINIYNFINILKFLKQKISYNIHEYYKVKV